jgi:hypothetical protein
MSLWFAGVQKTEIGKFRAETAAQIRAFRRPNSENYRSETALKVANRQNYRAFYKSRETVYNLNYHWLGPRNSNFQMLLFRMRQIAYEFPHEI